MRLHSGVGSGSRRFDAAGVLEVVMMEAAGLRWLAERNPITNKAAEMRATREDRIEIANASKSRENLGGAGRAP